MKALLIAAILSVSSFATPLQAQAPCNAAMQQGCCSWHQGVCGCSDSGRKVCCDGTLSPSCRC